MPFLLFLGLTASAAEFGAFATLGGDVSTGLRTGLDGGGAHGELAVELGGEVNAVHLGLRSYVTWVKGAQYNIPGVNLGWAHTLGDDDDGLGGYTLVALGGYRSDVLPVMPILLTTHSPEVLNEFRGDEERVFVLGEPGRTQPVALADLVHEDELPIAYIGERYLRERFAPQSALASTRR